MHDTFKYIFYNTDNLFTKYKIHDLFTNIQDKLNIFIMNI